MIRFKYSIALLASLAVVVAAGCQQAEQPATATPPGVTAQVPVASKLTFLNAALAKEVSASGDITAIKAFAPTDTIHAFAILEGKEGSTQIRVEILDKQGNIIAEGVSSGNVILKAAIPVELTAPQGGWLPGDYVAKFYMDGVPSWEIQFIVAQ